MSAGAVELHDRVINHIFGSGLALASMLSGQRVDDEVAERLRDVIEALDAAVAELRDAALVRAIRDHDPQPEPSHAAPSDGHRRLSHFTANDVFAYAIGGHDFHRACDNSLWAHESDDLLLSARFGTPLARRVGNVFYDIETNAPLYHEDGYAAFDDGN